jgi:hypothetical protein
MIAEDLPALLRQKGRANMFLDLCLFLLAASVVLVLPMLPMYAVRLQLGNLLAKDPTTLAPATAGNKMYLITTAFNANESLTVADLTFASGNGLDPIVCAVGNQEVAIDPVSQAQIITLVPGAGTGFRWVTTGTLPAPVTIYGFALTDGPGAILLATESLVTPIVLTSAGYQIDADPKKMTLVLQPIV